MVPLLATELIAIASSPVPLTKFVRSREIVPDRCVESHVIQVASVGQMLGRAGKFCTVPLVPEAQKPDSVGCVQMPVGQPIIAACVHAATGTVSR